MKRWHALLIVAAIFAVGMASAWLEPCDGHSCARPRLDLEASR